MATGNSTLQLEAQPSMRGRVMALWFVAFQGSTPIGGPIIGWIMAFAGARAGLSVGALTCFVAALIGLLALRDRHPVAATRALMRRVALPHEVPVD
jgi:MFS family permease